MNYQDFKREVIVTLEEQLKEQATITVQEVLKNNSTKMDGITILSDGINISPTIYLNPYYEKYKKGIPLPQICRDILTLYHRHKPTQSIDVTFFTDYEKAKSRIIFNLISFSQNEDLLREVPYVKVCDLAAVFCCLVDSGPKGLSFIQIRTEHLAYWQISADELYALALDNTPRLLPYQTINMSKLLHTFLPPDEPQLPIYILTNRFKLNGAACLLYPGLLHGISEEFEADFYIIPSSIHEVMLIPSYCAPPSDELSAMVRDVNGTELSADEILSDHAYYFSRENGMFT